MSLFLKLLPALLVLFVNLNPACAADLQKPAHKIQPQPSILVSASVSASGYGGGRVFTFQEFASLESCENAIQTAKELARKLAGNRNNDPDYMFQCVKK